MNGSRAETSKSLNVLGKRWWLMAWLMRQSRWEKRLRSQ
jgi:hypothetical protein